MRAHVASETAAGLREIILAENSTWSAQGRPDEIQIECREGEVWITQEGDPRDIILHAGERYATERQGRVVVQPITGARIIVSGVRSE
jgi:Protein of unknown function (DUF2917)